MRRIQVNEVGRGAGMTYKQAMRQKCKCGKYYVGGWYGDKKTGRPSFSRVSSSRMVGLGITMCEEHTLNGCYAPQQIA